MEYGIYNDNCWVDWKHRIIAYSFEMIDEWLTDLARTCPGYDMKIVNEFDDSDITEQVMNDLAEYRKAKKIIAEIEEKYK